MTTRSRSRKKPPRRQGPSKASNASEVRRSRGWLFAGIALAAVVSCGTLIAVLRLHPERRKPAESMPLAPQDDQARDQAGSKPDLTAQERAAALKDEELRFAERLVKEFPKSEEPLILLGRVHRRRGDTEQAVRLWEKALQMNPRRRDVYKELAQLAFDLDEYEKAIALWRKALEIDPAIEGAHVYIARALIAQGRYQESVPEAQEGTRLWPDKALCWYVLGQAYQYLQDYEQAKHSYEKAVELQPDHTEAHYGLYTLHARLKETDEARHHIAEFKRCKEKDEQELRETDQQKTDLTLFSKGVAELCIGAYGLYDRTDDEPRKIQLLERAISMDPQNTVYREKLATLHANAGRYAEALFVCRGIEQIDPGNSTCQLNIAKLSLFLGRDVEAETAMQKAISLSPGHYSGYQELARFYLRTGTNLRRARELAQKAVELEPLAANYFLLGWASDVNGDRAAAETSLQKAIQLDPRNAEYRKVYEQFRIRGKSK